MNSCCRMGAVTKWPLKGLRSNYAMALNEHDHRVFTITRKPPMMVVLETESGKEVTRLRAAGECDDVFLTLRANAFAPSAARDLSACSSRMILTIMNWWPMFLLRSASAPDIFLPSATAFMLPCLPKAMNQPRFGHTKPRISVSPGTGCRQTRVCAVPVVILIQGATDIPPISC